MALRWQAGARLGGLALALGIASVLGCSGQQDGPDASQASGPPDDAGLPRFVLSWQAVDGGENGAVLSAAPNAGAWALAVDGTHLVWAMPFAIFDTALNTGATQEIWARDDVFDEPISLALDDAGVFWTAVDGYVHRLDRATGAAGPIGAASGTSSVLGMSGSTLVVGDSRGAHLWQTDGGARWRDLPVGGSVFSMAVDGHEAFASVLPDGGGFFLDIVRFDLDGNVLTLAPGEQVAYVLGVDAQFVYWGSGDRFGDGGTLSRVARDGGPREVLLTTDLPVVAGTVTEGKVYFATFPAEFGPNPAPPQRVYRYDLATGITVPLARDLSFVTAMVLAPDGLYFVEDGRNRLDRIVPLP